MRVNSEGFTATAATTPRGVSSRWTGSLLNDTWGVNSQCIEGYFYKTRGVNSRCPVGRFVNRKFREWNDLCTLAKFDVRFGDASLVKQPFLLPKDMSECKVAV